MFLDVYYYVLRDDMGNLENSIIHSTDGLEARLIAKDLLYKFHNWLMVNHYRGFNLQNRLCRAPLVKYVRGRMYRDYPIKWLTRKRFKEFLKTEGCE